MATATLTKAEEKKPWDPADTKMPAAQIAMIEQVSAKRDLWAEMEPFLKEAGLPTIPGKIIGRQFILAPATGAQEKRNGIVSGTVIGYYVDTEGALTLCLSEPYPSPAVLRRFKGGWQLEYRSRHGQNATQACQFELL